MTGGTLRDAKPSQAITETCATFGFSLTRLAEMRNPASCVEKRCRRRILSPTESDSAIPSAVGFAS
jgi:hypothetical protein